MTPERRAPEPADLPSAPPDRRLGSSLGDALVRLLERTTDLPASELTRVVDLAGQVLGASSARVLIADYGLASLQELGEDGPTGPRQAVAGTLAGRSFERGEIVTSGERPASVWIPLAEGSERLGVLELTHESWSEDVRGVLGPVVRVLVLVLISMRRYTDVFLRSRRSQPLSIAAEIQWDLLPPLTCATARVSVSGILEPAYAIGGDSFDYALNPNRAEFAIFDAVGHGMPAVSISSVAVNGFRNARREGASLETAYLDTGEAIRTQFGRSTFVTAQTGSLELDTGELTWLNAGHPLPLLFRNRGFVGELVCRPSLPLGLGGSVNEVAVSELQPGDWVLFHTDGVAESRSADGEPFGTSRLADFVVRAMLDETSPAETVRRLASGVLDHNHVELRDDATLLLIEYRGSNGTEG